jgi:uncharacterized membrane protein
MERAMDKNRKYIALAMIGITVVIGIVSVICLPEKVAVQWNSFGEARNFLSKYLALAIGLGCGAFGTWYWYGRNRSSLVGIAKQLWQILDFVVGCVGIIVFAVFLFMNL